jgi:predicted ester cyclase
MSVERTQKALMAYLDCLGQRGSYGKYFTDAVTFTLMGTGQTVTGRTAVEQFIRGFHEQAFDANPQLKTTMVGDDRAAIEMDFVGIHTGEFGGVPASGKHVNVPYAVVYDFVGDQIAALRLYMPMDVLIQQISAVPELVEARA